jgi:hypothetical protein
MLTIAFRPSTLDLISTELTALMSPLSVTLIVKSPRSTVNNPVPGFEPSEPPVFWRKNPNAPTATTTVTEISMIRDRLANPKFPTILLAGLLMFFNLTIFSASIALIVIAPAFRQV